MHSVYMNLILQAIEALICFNFYESINNTDRKLINAVTIQIGYLIMAGINILFNYNVIINTAVLLIFQLLFARILYKMKAVFFVVVFPAVYGRRNDNGNQRNKCACRYVRHAFKGIYFKSVFIHSSYSGKQIVAVCFAARCCGSCAQNRL